MVLEMLPIRWEKLRSAVATIDFVAGFFLLFGGGNLAYRAEGDFPGMNQVMGITFMIAGLALFLSAARIMQNRSVGFRPLIYFAIAIASTGFILFQRVQGSLPISRQDLLAWIGFSAATLGCMFLQFLLKKSTPPRTSR